MNMSMPTTPIPSASLNRLILYLNILEELELSEIRETTSQELAIKAQVSPFQVRKDLTCLGGAGTRGKGYIVPILKRELMTTLRLHHRWRVVIVGMGTLGHALAQSAFNMQPFTTVGFFDPDPHLVGHLVGTSPIHHLSQLSEFAEQNTPEMAILTVPNDQAQQAAEQIVDAGIFSILNFTEVLLPVPSLSPYHEGEKYDNGHKKWHNVVVENINFLTALKRLAYRTQQLQQSESEDI